MIYIMDDLYYGGKSGRIPQGSQFSTFDNDIYIGNLGLYGNPLSKGCQNDTVMQSQYEDEDDDYLFGGFTWEAVVIGYGCGVMPAFIIGKLMLLAGKPKWFAGIIVRELGLENEDNRWETSEIIAMLIRLKLVQLFQESILQHSALSLSSMTQPDRYSNNYPPLLHGAENYNDWKFQIKIFLQHDAFEWDAVEKGFTIPMKERKPKSLKDLSPEEVNAMNSNAKAMNSLLNGMVATELRKVSVCTTAKQIWDTIKVHHEGTSKVREVKLSMLMSDYEGFERNMS
ncbi:hypothetical protein AgCh_023970 [Apium graveolens]